MFSEATIFHFFLLRVEARRIIQFILPLSRYTGFTERGSKHSRGFCKLTTCSAVVTCSQLNEKARQIYLSTFAASRLIKLAGWCIGRIAASASQLLFCQPEVCLQ